MKKPFHATVEEDLNRSHKVTLTEGQIATILYVMEGYIQGNDEYEGRFQTDVDNIFEALEGTMDKFYGYTANDVAQCVIETNGDYAECVDRLVDSMNPTFHMDQAFAKLDEEL